MKLHHVITPNVQVQVQKLPNVHKQTSFLKKINMVRFGELGLQTWISSYTENTVQFTNLFKLSWVWFFTLVKVCIVKDAMNFNLEINMITIIIGWDLDIPTNKRMNLIFNVLPVQIQWVYVHKKEDKKNTEMPHLLLN